MKERTLSQVIELINQKELNQQKKFLIIRKNIIKSYFERNIKQHKNETRINLNKD